MSPTNTSLPPIKTPLSPRLKKLPAYVFATLEEMKAVARAKGAQLIDLGLGSPDQQTPKPILETIQKAVMDPANCPYPNFKGKPELREAVAKWMKARYNVDGVDPETEVLPLIGSKEGLAHLTFAFIGEGDITLVPSPYYPVHSRATWLAGGEVHHMPLTSENNFLPDVDKVPADIAKKAKLLIVNYPNNPTTAVADLAFYEKVVAFCKKYDIVLVSDLAYAEICFDGYRPPSIFNVPGAKDIAIEFHSFSKSFNMAGWRIGFAVGHPEIIKALYSAKTNLDYGVCSAIQDGAVKALSDGAEYLPTIVKTYQERRDTVVEGFKSLGWPVNVPKASMFVWLPVPPRFENSTAWCQYLLDETGVVITPGIAFGTDGDRYFRLSLVKPVDVLKEAIQRLSDKGIRFDG